MPTKPRPKKPHRLNLEMSDDVRDRLDRLVSTTGADSKAEVIRRALAVYEHLHEKRGQGLDIVVVEKNGKRTSVLL